MMMTLWKYSCGRRKAGIEEFGRWLPTLPFIPGATFYPLLLRVPSLILTLLLFIQLLNSILGMPLPHLVLQLLTKGSQVPQPLLLLTTKSVGEPDQTKGNICNVHQIGGFLDTKDRQDLSFLCSLSHFRPNFGLEKTKRKIWASNKMLIVLNESNTVVINMA